MEFFVYSRLAVERIAPFEEPHIFISITTTAGERARLPENEQTLGVLRLSFVDRHEPPGDVFTEAMADAIVAFTEKHHAQGVKAIIVHCDAGVSRSPAVAAALARGIFAEDDVPFFRRYVPNRLVYRSIRAACLRPEQAIDACMEAVREHATFGAPFRAEEIATLEEIAGRPLPRAYRHLLRRWGSLRTKGLSLLPYAAIVERTETLQSLDEGMDRVHRVLVFEERHAFDFRVENDFGEPNILEHPPERGIDSFPVEPQATNEQFTAWLHGAVCDDFSH